MAYRLLTNEERSHLEALEALDAMEVDDDEFDMIDEDKSWLSPVKIKQREGRTDRSDKRQRAREREETTDKLEKFQRRESRKIGERSEKRGKYDRENSDEAMEDSSADIDGDVDDGPLKLKVKYKPVEKNEKENLAFEVEVAYPPENMKPRKKIPGEGQLVHINRHKKAAVFLSNVPSFLDEDDLFAIFEDYFIDRLILVRDHSGPTGRLFIFGPLFYMKLLDAWAPNVKICKHQITAVLLYETDFPKIFTREVLNAIFYKQSYRNRLYFEQY